MICREFELVKVLLRSYYRWKGRNGLEGRPKVIPLSEHGGLQWGDLVVGRVHVGQARGLTVEHLSDYLGGRKRR
jgi:hypothetical protein